MNLPNLITLGRLSTAPVLVWLIISGHLTPAFFVFVVAGISDAVDGYIAKRFNSESEFGRFLDPLADKVLLVCVFLSLGNAGLLPGWLVILIVFRDVLIVGGAVLYQTVTHSLSIRPLILSKVNTAIQIILAGTVLGTHLIPAIDPVIIQSLIYATATTTFLSGSQYVIEWTRRAALAEDQK